MEIKQAPKLTEKPFVYVSGRTLLRTTPAQEFLPYCMTKTKGEEIAGLVGEELDIRFDSSPRFVSSRTKEMYSAFAQGKAKLLDIERIHVAQDVKEFDGFYRFLMQTQDPELLQRILTRKDLGFGSERAFQRFSSHWGDQRWSCLTLDITLDEKPVFRTDVDIFAPASGEPSDLFILGFYSHKPDWHESK